MPASRAVFVLGSVAVLGCSSASFSVEGEDTGAIADSATETGGDATSTDGAVESGGGDAVTEAGGCVAPLPNAADLYVNNTSTATIANGSIDCPFRAIQDALTFIGPTASSARRVHVKGSTPIVPYPEVGALILHANVTLVGDGPISTRITASGGACPGPVMCDVYVEHGAVLDGFAVVAGARHGITTQTGYGSPAAAIRNVTAAGATGDGNFGILTKGSADVGPGISVTYNARAGLTSWGNGELRILGGGAPNSFDYNGQSGLNIEGSAHLTFNAGTCNNNVTNGIRFLVGPPGGGAAHNISNLVARGNGQQGIHVYVGGHSLVIRNSTFLHNRFGILYTQGPSGTLDLGNGASNGNNVFSSVSAPGDRNVNAAICIEAARTGTVTAEGDRWTSCPIVQNVVSACDGGPPYADVWFHPLVTGGTPTPPISSSTGCTPAP